MSYQYENLDPEKFQQFCQALLTNSFPNLQCYPVGQPDGGRDGISRRARKPRSSFSVFQVKFNRRALAEPDPHKWLLNQISKEVKKVKGLIPRGADQYYLLTNVPGTAHLDVGTIDRVETTLAAALGIPVTCWWRDDLDRRLDAAPALKWAYPELMTGQDVLLAALISGLSENKEIRQNAIRAYISVQYSEDEEVKFKQVELQNHLLDLFIDIPIHLKISPRPVGTLERSVIPVTREIFDQDDLSEEWKAAQVARVARGTADAEEALGAASTLLGLGTHKFGRWCVIEGAPGQGKSTIAQYVCQVHRMRLLQRTDELKKIPEEHRTSSVRLPLKVDLRDFATWLSHKDPFAPTDAVPPAEYWNDSLEALLAYQITRLSGGIKFTVSDLHALAKVSSVLVVLDGFDEVADIEKRNIVVEEISKAAQPLTTTSASLQIVITSRPAAFANSPGFPDSVFPHFELQAVTLRQISEYAEKWMNARHLNGKDRRDFKNTLDEKVGQPHLRDLARNPMQLAILLSLIQTRGSSLPDKRTALYDSYMDKFFSRESEKSAIVREHRDLLISLHQYLAWILHAEAEQGKNRGSVTEKELHALVDRYLEREGHNVSLVPLLFTGMTERVVALVSRVQGTFEFEVQPLREYFAARFLYETAPYSPPGAERRGTKPDRFEVISRNFYWLNVTRFYAGCFSKGELSSLVDSLDLLLEDRDLKLIQYPRTLAGMFLSDWVFTQQPLLVKKVAALILKPPGIRYLFAEDLFFHGGSSLTLPERCGKDEILAFILEEVRENTPWDYLSALSNLATANIDRDDLRPIVKQRALLASGKQKEQWLKFLFLALMLEDYTLEDIKALFADARGRILQLLLYGQRSDYFETTTKLFDFAISSILSTGSRSFFFEKQRDTTIGRFGSAISPFTYRALLLNKEPADIAAVELENFEIWIPKQEDARGRTCNFSTAEPCDILFRQFNVEIRRSIAEWRTEIQPWENMVESGRRLFGEQWAFYCIAAISSDVESEVSEYLFEDLFDETVSLCRRASYARHKSGDVGWWETQFDRADSTLKKAFALLMAMKWADSLVHASLLVHTDRMLSDLPKDQWSELYGAVNEFGARTPLEDEAVQRLLDIFPLPEPQRIGVRTVALYAYRVSEQATDWLYNSYLTGYEGDDAIVWQFCQSASYRSAQKSPQHWPEAIAVMRRSYPHATAFHSYVSTRQLNMPLSLAREVCEAADDFPLGFLRAAEQVVAESVRGAIRPVGDLARQARWFELD